MRIIEIGLLWEGSLSLLIIAIMYVTQAWYREPLGRFIFALILALLSVYIRPIITSITRPQLIVESITGLTFVAIFAILLTYGVYAFAIAIKKRQTATEQIDEWKD